MVVDADNSSLKASKAQFDGRCEAVCEIMGIELPVLTRALTHKLIAVGSGDPKALKSCAALLKIKEYKRKSTESRRNSIRSNVSGRDERFDSPLTCDQAEAWHEF